MSQGPSIKVASVQVSVEDNAFDANMSNARAMALRVAENEKGVDLMLFHEGCLEGGVPLEQVDEAMTARALKFWKELAAQTGINILAGRLERRPDGKLYNMATVFAPDGFIIANLVEKPDTYFVCTLFKDEVDKRHKSMKWLEWVRPDLYERFYV